MPNSDHIYNFSGATVIPLRTIKVQIKFGERINCIRGMTMFTVVDAPADYNCIISRETLSAAFACVSIRALPWLTYRTPVLPK